jgi:hypothetical protein
VRVIRGHPSLGAAGVMAAAACLAPMLVGCSGPIDLTVVNPCSVEVHVQTYDGELDAAGNWVPDAEPVANFVVPAGSTKREKDALMFVTAPEEIRILAPVQQSFLINITTDLDDDDRWTVPSEVCEGLPVG